MPSVEVKLRELLSFAQTVLDDLPIGILILSARGTPMLFNREAELACAVWNGVPLRADAFPLERTAFKVPPALWAACKGLLVEDERAKVTPKAHLLTDLAHEVHALIRLRHRGDRSGPPAFFIQLDYRRPRQNRELPLSPSAVALLSRLSVREREVAVRLRDGMTNEEISRALRRSRLTVKTQLSSVFSKLGVSNRARVAAMLNR